VLAVYRATAEAARRARAGEGPSLVEAKTYRFHEHAYGLQVPSPYRDQSEVDSWFTTVDPVALFHDRLVGWGVATADELAALRDAVQSEVDAAVEFARVSPFPPPEAAYTDVYSEASA
jgi:pyruvate dehydrogenase E1 component alpha subunit